MLRLLVLNVLWFYIFSKYNTITYLNIGINIFLELLHFGKNNYRKDYLITSDVNGSLSYKDSKWQCCTKSNKEKVQRLSLEQMPLVCIQWEEEGVGGGGGGGEREGEGEEKKKTLFP